MSKRKADEADLGPEGQKVAHVKSEAFEEVSPTEERQPPPNTLSEAAARAHIRADLGTEEASRALVALGMRHEGFVKRWIVETGAVITHR